MDEIPANVVVKYIVGCLIVGTCAFVFGALFMRPVSAHPASSNDLGAPATVVTTTTSPFDLNAESDEQSESPSVFQTLIGGENSRWGKVVYKNRTYELLGTTSANDGSGRVYYRIRDEKGVIHLVDQLP